MCFRRPRPARFLALLLAPWCPALLGETLPISPEIHNFRVVPVVSGLANPWGFVFLPDGSVLITERPGRLQHWREGELREVGGLPSIAAGNQGGLLDILLHPDYAENGWIYLTHSQDYEGGRGTVVSRGRLDPASGNWIDNETLYRMPRPGGGGIHFGSRLAFDSAGYLFVSIGDRGQPDRAQDLDRAEGSLLRLRDDGSVPPDNPFVGQAGALGEIWSYGHRNAQGLFYDAATGILWQHEHGPQGGDTLNRIERGANYGWPVATYGVEYGSAQPIGTTPDEREDIANPFAYWVPTSIAPSGLTVYGGHVFPGWRGNLFIGALAQQHIRRVVPGETGPIGEEELVRNAFGRIRDIREGPDGFLYFLTDAHPGGTLFRIEPERFSPWFALEAFAGWRYTGLLEGGVNLGWVYDGFWP